MALKKNAFILICSSLGGCGDGVMRYIKIPKYPMGKRNGRGIVEQ